MVRPSFVLTSLLLGETGRPDRSKLALRLVNACLAPCPPFTCSALHKESIICIQSLTFPQNTFSLYHCQHATISKRRSTYSHLSLSLRVYSVKARCVACSFFVFVCRYDVILTLLGRNIRSAVHGLQFPSLFHIRGCLLCGHLKSLF